MMVLALCKTIASTPTGVKSWMVKYLSMLARVKSSESKNIGEMRCCSLFMTVYL